MANVISQQMVKTRKVHRCQGCSDAIGVGSDVERTVDTGEDRISSHYWCAICVRFMGTLPPEDLAEGFAYGDMWEYDDYRELRDDQPAP